VVQTTQAEGLASNWTFVQGSIIHQVFTEAGYNITGCADWIYK
jgi:hypothetical protein